MKFLSIPILAGVLAAAAEDAAVHDYSSPLVYSGASTATATSHYTGNYEATATLAGLAPPSSTSTGMSQSEYDLLPHALKQFIIEMSPKSHLEERQYAGAAAGGGAVAVPSPTQLSPTTVYDCGRGPTTYTQLFAPTPDQFPSPSAGTVGLGQIQGQVGKMRTYSNPAPTAHVDSRLVVAIAGGIGALIL